MTGRRLAVLVTGAILLIGCSTAVSLAPTPVVQPSAVNNSIGPTSAPPSVFPQPSTAALIGDGDYETGHITPAMMTAALNAAGLGDQAAATINAFGFQNYVMFTLRLRAGKYVQFQAVDGGPTEAASIGTIVSVTHDTMVLQETQSGSPVGPPKRYAIRLEGTKLHIDLVSGPTGDDFAIVTAIYESSPWTRKP